MIKAVILCGGIGKRMFPITTDKSLINFAGKSLILHQIDIAYKAGINDFLIVANPENKVALQAELKKVKNIKIDFCVQKKAAGMADALFTIAGKIKNTPFILASSNDVFTVKAYKNLMQVYLNDKKYSAYITSYRVNDYFPGGYLSVNSKSEIKGIIEKPPRGEEPSDLVNIVLHLHTQPQKLFQYMSEIQSDYDDIYEKALDQMIKNNLKMKAIIHDGPWKTIKYPWHILEVMDHISSTLKRKVSSSAMISDKAIIEGNVIIGDKVKVFENAVVKGPAYIGNNTVIGTNALVRDSFIGRGCVIGYNTEIKHSYIGDDCWFHSNYIGDSIIESNCSFGAGAITANFRLDEQNINVKEGGNFINTGHDKLGAIIGHGGRIGINASLMPGVKIGQNSVIGPHVCLTDNLESNKMALSDINYFIQDNTSRLAQDKRIQLLNKLNNKREKQ